MGSIFGSLLNSTGALAAYTKAFGVLQNNIANVNTPGYVKQDQVLISLPFSPGGAPGGVVAGPLVSSRSPFLERTVQYQQGLYGDASQRAADLAAIEPQFDLTSGYGVSGALNKFFDGFSALAVNPNDPVARQSVLDLASSAADSFQRTGTALRQASSNADIQTRAAVTDINQLAQRIVSINSQYRQNSSAVSDPGLDAQLNSTLEELSSVTSFTLVRTPDGAANVYLGGQSVLVLGDKAHPLQADITNANTVIRSDAGDDITNLVQGGKLKALLSERNTTIPGYTADLNTLAASFADNVNATLAGGVDRNGLPPSVNLFTYTPGNAASSLATNNLSPDEVAAASAANPGGNDNALAVSKLATAQVTNGLSFSEFFGNLGAKVGRDSAAAKADSAQFQDTLAQARTFRSAQTGVSLDEEAAKLLQLQQSYQAVGKLINVISSLTDTIMGIIH